MAGPPVMHHPDCLLEPAQYARRFLTALLGVPLATGDMKEGDTQGTLTLHFHENKDKDGNPSNRVFGVSSCHVLRKDTHNDYEQRGIFAPKEYVRMCSLRRFRHGLYEITDKITEHSFSARSLALQVAALQGKEGLDEEGARSLRWCLFRLGNEHEALTGLEALYHEIKSDWSDIKHADRTIGCIQHAKAVKVDQDGPCFTLDWAAFQVSEAKFGNQFEGNVATDDDKQGKRCFTVGKDGTTTGLKNGAGTESIELGIYDSGVRFARAFSGLGDSGALVWHIRDGKTKIVRQIRSGQNKGGSTRNYITYSTLGSSRSESASSMPTFTVPAGLLEGGPGGFKILPPLPAPCSCAKLLDIQVTYMGDMGNI
ncbi:hypothetical protein L198_02213 [Cryptococcus wingfieldii CBS 7118]|uniref:Uncharacterized protein n=1 Tax=Cryptococcus wingfieldii CBS 7118 TaxID=1295528 RepID=A0A1E3JTD8_9TREE|nr:hypothetical protein L198_02213 [Cryptococcus wingfieldii CBS 7118]ODO03367.1 hypothetical protein L198_02213 [Cryptococcus wingfieldii CBS 7118]